jgi:hypothetical protein
MARKTVMGWAVKALLLLLISLLAFSIRWVGRPHGHAVPHAAHGALRRACATLVCSAHRLFDSPRSNHGAS